MVPEPPQHERTLGVAYAQGVRRGSGRPAYSAPEAPDAHAGEVQHRKRRADETADERREQDHAEESEQDLVDHRRDNRPLSE